MIRTNSGILRFAYAVLGASVTIFCQDYPPASALLDRAIAAEKEVGKAARQYA